eukprot:2229020-Pleurochrysis_carterae.AAC.4
MAQTGIQTNPTQWLHGLWEMLFDRRQRGERACCLRLSSRCSLADRARSYTRTQAHTLRRTHAFLEAPKHRARRGLRSSGRTVIGKVNRNTTTARARDCAGWRAPPPGFPRRDATADRTPG